MNQVIEKLLLTNAPMDFEKGADSDSILQFEQTTGLKLPAAYREWLMYSNGGEIFVPGTRFFGTDSSQEYSLIVQNNSEKRNIFSMDKTLLVIGRLNFGDIICIDLNNGEVVQWDHETDEEFLRWENFFVFLDEEITSFLDEG